MFTKYMVVLIVLLGMGAGTTGCAGLEDSSVRLSIGQSEKTVSYVDAFELDKNQIYDRSLSWVTQAFASSKTVIDMKDRDAGIISIHAIDYVPVAYATAAYKYTMQIRVKDKKSKITFTVDGMETQYGGQTTYPPVNGMKNIHATFSSLHKSFVSAIANATQADDF